MQNSEMNGSQQLIAHARAHVTYKRLNMIQCLDILTYTNAIHAAESNI